MAPNSERMYTMSTAPHTCQPAARSNSTAAAVQGGIRTIDTTHPHPFKHMQPVAVVVVHARDVDVEPALRKVADAVLIVVARQGLRHPEQGVGSIHDAEDRIHDEQRLCALGACQPRRTDDGSAHKAQQHIDCIQRQELLGPGLTALRRLCREGQRLADEFFRLLAGKALFFFDAAALQKLGHRHVQNFCQRHQQRDIRHAQARFP